MVHSRGRVNSKERPAYRIMLLPNQGRPACSKGVAVTSTLLPSTKGATLHFSFRTSVSASYRTAYGQRQLMMSRELYKAKVPLP